MSCIAYRNNKPQQKTLELINKANGIIKVYQQQGYTLTLRQVYYQLVSRDIIQNTPNSYKNIENAIATGRMNGLIDWVSIEDRTRSLRKLSHWDSPIELIEAAAEQYHRNLWEEQPYYLEVWIEKDALIGIVEKAAHALDVSCFSCRGYNSHSEMWSAAQRIIAQSNKGKECVIIHLGDHDPSGVDMTRDNQKRLDEFHAHVNIKRIALTMEQIQQYSPPPNTAKEKDTRYESYKAKFGQLCWELDALEPAVLDRLVTDTIKLYLDQKLFDKAKERLERERAVIYEMIKSRVASNE